MSQHTQGLQSRNAAGKHHPACKVPRSVLWTVTRLLCCESVPTVITETRDGVVLPNKQIQVTDVEPVKQCYSGSLDDRRHDHVGDKCVTQGHKMCSHYGGGYSLISTTSECGSHLYLWLGLPGTRFNGSYECGLCVLDLYSGTTVPKQCRCQTKRAFWAIFASAKALVSDWFICTVNDFIVLTTIWMLFQWCIASS